MYAGALISLISGIAAVVTVLNARSGFFADMNKPGPRVVGVVFGVIFAIVVPVMLWLWMAWKCKAGRSWARIVSTVLFGVATLATLTTLRDPSAWGLGGTIASWLVGLGATVLLWQRSSSWYFRPAPRY